MGLDEDDVSTMLNLLLAMLVVMHGEEGSGARWEGSKLLVR